jgi:hypothetical protein
MRRNSKQKRERACAGDAKMFRAWKKFHREKREAVLTGPHGAVLNELFCMLDNLQHVQPPQLIGLTRSIDWASIDYNTRLVVLHETNTAIATLREKRGLEPINDNLPNEPDAPFRTIKAIVLTPSPRCEGAIRGAARPE